MISKQNERMCVRVFIFVCVCVCVCVCVFESECVWVCEYLRDRGGRGERKRAAIEGRSLLHLMRICWIVSCIFHNNHRERESERKRERERVVPKPPTIKQMNITSSPTHSFTRSYTHMVWSAWACKWSKKLKFEKNLSSKKT